MNSDLRPLAELKTLDRELLHVFVAGPGVGEGIAIALPGAGWVLVDGCRVPRGGSPLQAMLDDYRSAEDPVLAMILTHPHDDHANGFAGLLDALAPRTIAVTGKDPAGPSLIEQTHGWLRQIEQSHSDEEIQRRLVVSALRAVERWESANPGGLTIAVDGTTMAWPESKASLTVHAPAKGAHLDKILDELADGNRAHANEASVVAQVSFGDTRVLLGGDLPRVRSTNHERSIPTGWDSVMEAHPELAGATGLKLPHHGSAGAFHSGLMKQGEGAWVVTPYDSSRLPRLEDGGLPDLLECNPRVYLSRLGSAMAVTRGTELRDVPLKALRGGVKANPTGDPFLDTAGHDIRTARCEPRDPIWGFAFDDHGGAVRQWFGEEAVLVRR